MKTHPQSRYKNNNIKKKIKFLIIVFLSTSAVISCEKVIDINLNDSEPKLVVEAAVSTDVNSALVFLTKSVNFKQSEIPKVSGAQIRITDLTSNVVYPLSEIDEGVYENSSLVALPGRNYKLTVIAEGKTYTSISGISGKVDLDGLEQKPFSNSSFFSEVVEIIPKFNDPVNAENYYQFKYIRNDTLQRDILLLNDSGINGAANTKSFLVQAKKNDKLTFELQCIDKAVYNYMVGLNENLMNYSATPSNPPSNISNGALGYFKVYSSSDKEITVN